MAQKSQEDDESAKSAGELRAKILEGVDFIETEEDAEAVESAVVKIQSTFRGKKIRSKLGAKAANSSANNNCIGEDASNKQQSSKDNASGQTSTSKTGETNSSKRAEELSSKVAKMQVNDNNKKSNNNGSPQEQGGKSSSTNAPEDEAERAATKIQAGFKGYKTRKELEGKLAGQQMAPAVSKEP